MNECLGCVVGASTSHGRDVMDVNRVPPYLIFMLLVLFSNVLK